MFPTKKIRIGIVAKSIGRMYVETTDMAKKTFNIKKTGEYSVFVTNKSDSTIHVVGNYTKIIKERRRKNNSKSSCNILGGASVHKKSIVSYEFLYYCKW